MRPAPAAILLPLLLAGCPTRAKPDFDASNLPDGTDGSGGPSLQITSPANGTYAKDTLTVTVVATGAAVPAAISLFLDTGSTPIGTPTGPSPYSFSWDTTKVAEGPHTLVAKATVGGQPIVSAPITVNVDRTAPKVMTTTPATGATDVVLRAPITVVFSEPIAPASLTPTAVTLTIGGTAVATNVSLSADGTIATITINDLTSFVLPTTFAVTFDSHITDLAGNALSVALAPWSWTVPDWIKYASFASYSTPIVAIGPDFLPVVSYTLCGGNSPAGCQYYINVLQSDGQQWNPLGQLDSLIGPGSLDLDSQGHAIVAGTGVDSATQSSAIFVVKWNGSNWDSSIPAIDGVGVSVSSPVAHVDVSGGLVTTWVQTSGTASDVSGARWTGTRWDTSIGAAGLPSATTQNMILDPQGNPVVGWGSATAGGVAAWNGTGWSETGGFSTTDPFVALDAMSNPLLIAENGGAAGFVVDRYANGSWQAETSSPVPVMNTAHHPHLVVTPDHRPVVAWVDTASTNQLSFCRWTGTQWDCRAGYFSGPSTSVVPAAPWITVDARGSIWIAWTDGLKGNVWMSNY